MTIEEQAAAAWLIVKSNLERRGRRLFDFDALDDKTAKLLDAEQTEAIASVFRSAKAEEEKAIAAIFGEEPGHQ